MWLSETTPWETLCCCPAQCHLLLCLCYSFQLRCIPQSSTHTGTISSPGIFFAGIAEQQHQSHCLFPGGLLPATADPGLCESCLPSSVRRDGSERGGEPHTQGHGVRGRCVRPRWGGGLEARSLAGSSEPACCREGPRLELGRGCVWHGAGTALLGRAQSPHTGCLPHCNAPRCAGSMNKLWLLLVSR